MNVEGLRNLLVGGSTTLDMAAGLAMLGAVGLVIYGAGALRLAAGTRRGSRISSVQAA